MYNYSAFTFGSNSAISYFLILLIIEQLIMKNEALSFPIAVFSSVFQYMHTAAEY